jgi:hypothetical protein
MIPHGQKEKREEAVHLPHMVAAENCRSSSELRGDTDGDAQSPERKGD